MMAHDDRTKAGYQPNVLFRNRTPSIFGFKQIELWGRAGANRPIEVLARRHVL
jgi:hypothetical protein